ncbi:MAG: metallophosphoesterase, partial [Candidatus Pacearchaeota archaeon]
KFCIEQGILLEPEVLNLLSESSDPDSVRFVLEKIKNFTHNRIITKTFFEQNKEKIVHFFSTLPKENQQNLEKLKIKLGLEIEISKQILKSPSEEIVFEIKNTEEKSKEEVSNVRVLTTSQTINKKIEVENFVKNFRNRFNELKRILQEHRELENLVSIGKINNGGSRISIIGMVFDKRITKNRNIIFEVEDLTGHTKVLINQNRPDLYKKAEDICLDSVVGFTGFGDGEIFFANNIVFPDSFLIEKKHSPIDENAVFLGDLHYGSKLFLEDKFRKFIDYLNGNLPGSNIEESKKIKYLFILGDIVSGVGIYPSQKKDLKITDLELQFQGLAELLEKIRKDIKIIISPGNHDGVRLLEPQPPLDEKYAKSLYNMKNVILTPNPAYVNIGATKDFIGFDVLTYHGVSYYYYANSIPSLMEKGLNAPEKIMEYLLKNRHLAPSYSSTQYFPFEIDDLVIKKIPDIIVSGHTHKCAISSYNGTLLISSGTWEEETEYQKRKGNKPDFCKVPMFNLKTRAIKILDFDDGQRENKLY